MSKSSLPMYGTRLPSVVFICFLLRSGAFNSPEIMVPNGVSMNNAESIRPVFTHLAGVAERTNCAIVLVGHVNKGTSVSSDRLLGSADIYNSVLSVMLVGRINREQGISALVHHKSNMDELGSSQAFRLSKRGGFEWLGECGATATDVLKEDDSYGDGTINADDVTAPKLEEAKALLADLLSDGSRLSDEVFAIADELDISAPTVNRAKVKLGVKSFKDGAVWEMDYIHRREKVIKR